MNAQRLKLLAILFMTIDHVGTILNTLYRYRISGAEFINYMSDQYWQMRLIGRLAFPMFAFLIAEGCAHTKDIKKYIGRLAVFALISEMPYQIFRSMNLIGEFRFYRFLESNVMVTLTLGAVAVFFYQKRLENQEKKMLYIFGIIATFIAVFLLRGSYDFSGILIILLVYIFRPNKEGLDSKVYNSKYMQVLCCALVVFVCYKFGYNDPWHEIVAAVSASLLFLFYNGEAGNRKGKWIFYIYYPAHLLLLAIIMFIVMK